jgi:hypothetical protein
MITREAIKGKNDPRGPLLKALKESEGNKEFLHVVDNAKFDNDLVELETKHRQVIKKI